MGNYGDDRGGGDRWHRDERGWRGDRDPDRDSGRWNEGRRESANWGPSDRDRGRDWRSGDDDRGFLDRAGDQLRSWFGDEEAQRRRELDERRWERERAMSGRRDYDYGDRGPDRSPERGGAGTLGGGGFGGGWGNQAGESWNRDRPGRPGWFTDSVGGERGHRPGASGGRFYGSDSERDRYGSGGSYSRGADRPELGGSDFDIPSDYGRRFDRIDAGSAGLHGTHPMSSRIGASGGTAMGGDREYEILRRGGGQYALGGRQAGYGQDHDPLYAEWRRRQIDELDRDYEEYRREHQTRFEQEFGGWRSKRQSQRQLLGRVSEHMDVVGSDGTNVGTVDKVAGDRIILTKTDAVAGGLHHSVPCGWVESVADKVTLNRSANDARAEWREEEHSRALFERRDSGSEGPHVLNRSFAGTYDEGEAGGPARSAERSAPAERGDRKS